MTVETEGQYGVFTPISVGVGTSAHNSEGLEKAWRFAIQHGPEGEANYAWVYNGKDLVATMRTQHASSIVEAMNRRALPPVDGLEVVAEVEGLLDAYWGLAFMEGREGRDTDTPEDEAQKTRSAISSRLVNLSQASSVIAGLTAERDAAQADAYRASALADLRQEQVKEAAERAAKNWRDFRDLRLAIIGDGPMCRDCADFDGRCQGTGQPCDPDEAVKEQLETWKAAEARISSLEEENKRLREALGSAYEHIEQLSELLKIIKNHWIDYDHVFSISVHEADEFLAARQALEDHND